MQKRNVRIKNSSWKMVAGCTNISWWEDIFVCHFFRSKDNFIKGDGDDEWGAHHYVFL